MADCISDIRNWLITDRLMLNDDKTKFILLDIRQQLTKVDVSNITAGSCKIHPELSVRN